MTTGAARRRRSTRTRPARRRRASAARGAAPVRRAAAPSATSCAACSTRYRARRRRGLGEDADARPRATARRARCCARRRATSTPAPSLVAPLRARGRRAARRGPDATEDRDEVHPARLHRHDRGRLLQRLRHAAPARRAGRRRAAAVRRRIGRTGGGQHAHAGVDSHAVVAIAPLGSRVARIAARPAGSADARRRRRPARRRASPTVPPAPVPDPRSAVDGPSPRSPRTSASAPCAARRSAAAATAGPGAPKGFCPKCRTPFSFTPKLQPGDARRRPVRGRRLPRPRRARAGSTSPATERVSDRCVVLKGLLNSGDADAYQAAIAERQFLAEVQHPLIVEIYNFVMPRRRRLHRHGVRRRPVAEAAS